ncbi:MAG: MFS transporter [Firmicutes bacterium]|nr:MFS transporter [Bacillota bacterium]
MTEREVSRQIVGISAAIHFLVDLACIFLATAFLIPLCGDRMDWVWVVMLYNMFAFAFQLPIGALGDRAGVSWKLAAAGCLIIAGAYGIAWAGISASPGHVLPAVIAVVAGIGNSCFHVGCGIAVLKRSRGRAALPGIYVSTGAFGVYLAPILASRFGPFALGAAAGILVMLGCAFSLARSGKTLQNGKVPPEEEREPAHRSGASPSAALMLTAASGLLITVLLRSYAGTIMAFSWKSVPLLALLFTLGIVLGKMLGGVIGDRIGWMKTAMVSLLAAAVLFAAALEHPAAGIAAVFLFNMTMPITLTALADLMKDRPGTAFGMTTLMLFLGTVPSLFAAAGIAGKGTPDQLPVVVLLSAVGIAAGLWARNRFFCRQNERSAGLLEPEQEEEG